MVVSSKVKGDSRGQWLSFILAVMCLGIAVYFGTIGMGVASTVSVISAIIPVVLATVRGLLKKQDSVQCLEEKSDACPVLPGTMLMLTSVRIPRSTFRFGIALCHRIQFRISFRFPQDPRFCLSVQIF